MQREAAWLTDIATGADRIARYVDGLEREVFLSNDEKQSAVFGQPVIIGEAANRVSREYQDAHPNIPWGQIVGLRNRIVHGYD